jgi:hypothetical protein
MTLATKRTAAMLRPTPRLPVLCYASAGSGRSDARMGRMPAEQKCRMALESMLNRYRVNPSDHTARLMFLPSFQGNNSSMSPKPATFVVGTAGLIKTRYIDPD